MLPFVSDFGAYASPTYGYFATAMTCAALLWMPLWFDHFQATQHARGPQQQGDPTRLEKVQPLVGLGCSLGVIGVALEPEDERLVMHGLSASLQVVHGRRVAFTGISTYLRRQRGQTWRGRFAGSSVGLFAFMMLGPSVMAGCVDSTDGSGASNCELTPSRAWAWFMSSMGLLQTHFKMYCKGQEFPSGGGGGAEEAATGRSIHGQAGVTFAAMFEWIMLIAILSNVLVTFHFDLRGWPVPGRAP